MKTDPDKIVKRSCRICHNKYEMTYLQYMQRLSTAANKVCTNPECMTEAAMRWRKKQEEKRRKAENEKRRKVKEETEALRVKWNMPKKKYEDRLLTNCCKIARLLDAGKPCYVYVDHQYPNKQGGHVYSTSNRPHLKYLLMNIHGESPRSNMDQNISDDYKAQCISIRYSNFPDLISYVNAHNKPLKPTRFERAHALKESQKIINRLNDGEELTRAYIDRALGLYSLPEDYNF